MAKSNINYIRVCIFIETNMLKTGGSILLPDSLLYI